jgi:hypothetical protein
MKAGYGNCRRPPTKAPKAATLKNLTLFEDRQAFFEDSHISSKTAIMESVAVFVAVFGWRSSPGRLSLS